MKFIHKVRLNNIYGFAVSNIRDIILHTTFYWVRILLVMVSLILFFDYNLRGKTLIIRFLDFTYMETMNLFLFYLVITASVDGNIFKLYLSVFFMIHNAILIIFPLIGVHVQATQTFPQWIITGLISFSYVLEAIITLTLIYLRRHISNLSIFKKIGLNKEINDAFATRKCLEALGIINIFLAVDFTIGFFSPVSGPLDLTSSLALGYLGCTVIQQLLTTIKINEEMYWMRIASIVMAILKLSIAIVMISFGLLVLVPEDTTTRSPFLYFLISDLILISLGMIYFLIADFRQFGSGLREYLISKPRNLVLSSSPEKKS